MKQIRRNINTYINTYKSHCQTVKPLKNKFLYLRLNCIIVLEVFIILGNAFHIVGPLYARERLQSS